MAQALGEQVNEEDVWIPSACYMCFNACSIRVRRVNGVVVKIEGDPDSPHNLGKLCGKGNSAIMSLYNPHRVTAPLRRTNPRKGFGVDPGFEEISWDEALDTVAERLKKVRAKDPRALMISTFDAHGFGPIGESFLSAFGSENFTSGPSGFFCGNNLHPLAWINHGTFFMESDVEHCKYLIQWGTQFGAAINFNFTGTAARFADSRQRGMKLVVVDPMCSYTASKANEWIAIRPGTDGALALGMLNVLLNELGIYDARFIKEHTNGAYLIGPDGKYARHPESGEPLVWDTAAGIPKEYHDRTMVDPAMEGAYEVEGVPCRPGFQLLKDHVRRYPPEKVAEITTVPAEVIRRIAREYGEAARIGSTITIDGVELPYRPAHVDWYRGINQHRYSMSHGVAVQLLNTVIGAVDVPGGHLGTSGSSPWWSPGVGPDGLLVPAREICFALQPYPPRKVRRAEVYELTELFPLSCYGRSMIHFAFEDPARFGLDYKLEVLLHARNNYMMTTVKPEWAAESYRQIPFIATFTHLMEASTEMADVVFPDTHFLERLDCFPNRIRALVQTGGYWYWMLRQPVVEPPAGVRHWVSVLFDLAERMGMLPEYHRVLNHHLALKEPWILDPDGRYGFEEICDRWCRSKFGPEHSLAWFKKYGIYKEPKEVRHTYPRPFLKGRIPLYYEYFLKAGEDVRRVTGELGLEDWDTDGYEAIPDWHPCPAFEPKGEHDLFLLNYKVPYHTQSNTYDNAWLEDLTASYPDNRTVLINTQTALRKGIAEGDEVIVESTNGHRCSSVAHLVETIHPEVAAVMGTQGHWIPGQPVPRGKGVHWNSMLKWDLSQIDKVTSALDACVRVRISKASG